jgi:hypothetical protein
MWRQVSWPTALEDLIPTSSSFHQKHYEMKSMDFFARLGADPQSHCQCGKGMQRRMAEKDAISCSGFGETDY